MEVFIFFIITAALSYLLGHAIGVTRTEQSMHRHIEEYCLEPCEKCGEPP